MWGCTDAVLWLGLSRQDYMQQRLGEQIIRLREFPRFFEESLCCCKKISVAFSRETWERNYCMVAFGFNLFKTGGWIHTYLFWIQENKTRFKCHHPLMLQKSPFMLSIWWDRFWPSSHAPMGRHPPRRIHRKLHAQGAYLSRGYSDKRCGGEVWNKNKMPSCLEDF